MKKRKMMMDEEVLGKEEYVTVWLDYFKLRKGDEGCMDAEELAGKAYEIAKFKSETLDLMDFVINKAKKNPIIGNPALSEWTINMSGSEIEYLKARIQEIKDSKSMLFGVTAK